jgi:hypothetical protein
MEEKKSWLRKHPVWSGVIGFFAIIFIIGIFTNGDSRTTGDIVDDQKVLDSSTDVDQENIKETTENEVQPITNNYQSCIKNIFKAECKKYNLLYTDYSSSVEFVTCTDDGSYTFDDIGDISKYLQIYTPTRILEIRCETYKEPTNSNLKCEEELFKSKCQQEGLIYTDWSSAVGFITCTDDGIYILDEIGEDNKYKQVYITQEFVDSQCN